MQAFAGAVAADPARRRWPQSFQPLLQTQTFDTEWSGGADLHFFTAGGITFPDLPDPISIHFERLDDHKLVLGRIKEDLMARPLR